MWSTRRVATDLGTAGVMLLFSGSLELELSFEKALLPAATFRLVVMATLLVVEVACSRKP